MITDSVKVNDIEMSYFKFGNGSKSFVMLPGVDTKSILLSAKAVEAAYRMFGDEYTVYVFDRRSNMPEDYTVRQMADDTAAVMRALDISGAYIFGASQGGMIAMCIAIDYPELVAKLVLGSTAARISSDNGAGRWVELARKHDMSALTADFIDSLYSRNTIGKYKELLLHMNDNVSDEDIRRFIIQTEAISGFDVYDELNKIKCPVLVIGVEGDKVIPPSCSIDIADKIGCELYMYSDEYGHCVFDEAPDYKQRIFDFFSD